MGQDIGRQVAAELRPYLMKGLRGGLALAGVLAYVFTHPVVAVGCPSALLVVISWDVYDIKRKFS